MSEISENYDSIKDEDLNSDKGYDTMILVCPQCGAMFGMKACGNRTLFPWFGYHPTDGNKRVVSSEWLQKNEERVDNCKRNVYFKRIRTEVELDEAITR